MNLTTLTNDELAALSAQILAERKRRAGIEYLPTRPDWAEGWTVQSIRALTT